MTSTQRHADQAIALCEAARRMTELGLNQGTAGNLSIRTEKGFLITPTGADCASLKPEGLVPMRFDGSHEGPLLPSSEWQFHRDIFQARPEVNAVLHAHPMFCTTLACLRLGIPSFHYMIAVAGGPDIRCAPYATFGSEELSLHAVEALRGRLACLLANHGMIAVGVSIEKALKLAHEVETLAAMYWRARQAGEPVLLDEDEMQRVLEKFKTYGQQPGTSK